MTSHDCQLLITDAGAPGFALRKFFSASENVEVRDQFTEALLRLPADAVQPSRHTLYLDGKAFRVLRVLT